MRSPIDSLENEVGGPCSEGCGIAHNCPIVSSSKHRTCVSVFAFDEPLRVSHVGYDTYGDDSECKAAALSPSSFTICCSFDLTLVVASAKGAPA